MNSLPMEILVYMATQDHGYVYREMLALPEFARYSFAYRYQMYRQMVQKTSTSTIKYYHLFGRLHRASDKPAVTKKSCKKWYKCGRLHRANDMPAKISTFANCWYWNGELHRDNDCPAYVSNIYDVKIWYQLGLKHRADDQPAYVSLSESIWFHQGFIHRGDDKPAVVSIQGYQIWCKFGSIYRENGPAMINSEGAALSQGDEFYKIYTSYLSETHGLKVAD